MAQGLATLKLDPSKATSLTLSGHTAGGSPVALTIAHDPKGCAEFDRVELYDAAVSSSLNPVDDSDRATLQAFIKGKPDRFLYVPGVMASSWRDYIDRSRWTAPEPDHWSALWDSLGQFRQPHP